VQLPGPPSDSVNVAKSIREQFVESLSNVIHQPDSHGQQARGMRHDSAPMQPALHVGNGRVPEGLEQLLGARTSARRNGKTGALGFINYSHTASTDLLENAIVRDGLADERVGTCHNAAILGWDTRQVNEEDLCPPNLQMKNYR